MSFDALQDKIRAMKNPTVAGLDARIEYVPEHIRQAAFEEHGVGLKGAAEAIYQFNVGLIDALCGTVPAVKPQAAYYERLGWPGVKALAETIAYAKGKGMFVITDGKRNDIGATMEAYAAAHLGRVKVGDTLCEPFGGDALTVNGYLGSDGIQPLLTVCRERDAGIFVLVKTSNPSSGELQDRRIDGEPVYRHMGAMCERWGEELPGTYGYSGVGAVVGATYPEMSRILRKLMPRTYFLVPGYGAQGGTAADLAHCFNEDGLGAVVNSSRGIIAAYRQEKYKQFGPEHFAEASRQAVIDMVADINSVL